MVTNKVFVFTHWHFRQAIACVSLKLCVVASGSFSSQLHHKNEETREDNVDDRA